MKTIIHTTLLAIILLAGCTMQKEECSILELVFQTQADTNSVDVKSVKNVGDLMDKLCQKRRKEFSGNFSVAYNLNSNDFADINDPNKTLLVPLKGYNCGLDQPDQRGVNINFYRSDSIFWNEKYIGGEAALNEPINSYLDQKINSSKGFDGEIMSINLGGLVELKETANVLGMILLSYKNVLQKKYSTERRDCELGDARQEIVEKYTLGLQYNDVLPEIPDAVLNPKVIDLDTIQ